MSLLAIDVGTSGLRAAIVRPDASVEHVAYRAFPPDTPFAGLVEFDATALAAAVLEVAQQALAAGGPVEAVGITNQRASTIVWDRATGEPIGPALGWQDLRTLGTCLELGGQGHLDGPEPVGDEGGLAARHLRPRSPARPLLRHRRHLAGVDAVGRSGGGALHVTDRSNAGVSGLLRADASGWAHHVLDALNIPETMLPSARRQLRHRRRRRRPCPASPRSPPSSATSRARCSASPACGPGQAKVTFGTGGMLDVCLGGQRPAAEGRGPHGTFPIVAWTKDGQLTWGAEAIMLSAGTSVAWLVEDLQLLRLGGRHEAVAAACDDTGDVWFVPAMVGLGTPHWDYGARSTFLGLTRGSGRPEIVRAVLEGVAHRGTDLVEAAEADTGVAIPTLRVDGGMSANRLFVQALADASQRPVEVSPVADATTLGAGYLAGLAVGTWSGTDDLAAAWRPGAVVEPARTLDRARWQEAVARAQGWIPSLSALDF